MSGIQQLFLGGSVQQAVDPYFYSVTSLLHGDGTNGGQNNTFLDSSTNNFTITRNGNTTQGAFSPFSQTGWGNYFDGSGDYLSVSGGVTNAGTGDFTLEFWAYYTGSYANYETIFDSRTSGGGFTNGFNVGLDITTGYWYAGFTVQDLLTTIPAAKNQWTHIAVTRSGTTMRLFVNGTVAGSITTSNNLTSTTNFIGTYYNANNYYFNGYISNFRAVKGTAVYTSNFTPSLTPLTAISGTSLLTCQANRFLDASSNAFAITRNGDVSVQPFSPFNPTTPYSTSSIGGSGYFDGSGDELTIANNAAFNLSSGAWTVEAWVYPTAFSGYNTIISARLAIWEIGVNTGTPNLYFYNGGLTTTSNTLTRNAWNHVAVSSNGTTISLFINGVLGATVATSPGSTASTVYIGSANGIQLFTGYISNLRVVKGTQVYTSAFTPPTAPLTAITNTSLLLSTTNGAIFDNAAVADYETVGNAQISTSVKKYGTGSMAFDGTGDRLIAPNNGNVLTLGTGDFTVEMWVYANTVATTWQGLIDWRPSDTSTYPALVLNTNTIKWVKFGGAMITSFAISASTWYHVAICRAGSSTKLFINGTQAGSTYSDTNNYLSASTIRVGSTFANEDLNGYIDDLRVSKGVARYLYNFTPPTAEFPNIGGTVTLTADPYFDYTTLLLPGNGTNGAQNNTFLDSSTNNFTITRNGNTTQGTFSPFSQTGWGNYFDGTGDYLSWTGTALGSGNFTAECWVYFNPYSTANYAIIGSAAANTSAGWELFLEGATSTIKVYSGGVVVLASSTVTANQWYHLAFVRSGSTVTLYINGTSVGTATLTANLSNTTMYVSYDFAGQVMAGYVSNVRHVVGTAVYTSNFTPSLTPLTAISGTSLLTCQSNRFIDNSTNAFAITRNGDVSVQAFSPFNPTAAWSASTNGGSGYFDGSGDYLTTTTSSAFDLSSGDWTIQGWYYPTAYSAGNNVVAYVGTSAGDKIVIATIGTGGGLYYLLNGSVVITGGSAPLNAWSFFALVKSGGTTTLYINGVSQGTTTSVPTSSNKSLNLGSDAGAAPYQGYIADFRILKGTANTAVPTAPLTAITNTSLLLNFTNAGIYDATSKNDLETVGNAQISTTQSKFGGSSMYFDGTGDYASIPATQNLVFGTGDFTIEMWLYSGSQSGTGVRMMGNGAGGSWASGKYILTTTTAANPNKFTFGVNNTSPVDLLVSTTTFNDSTWRHVAITRYGNVFRLFVNGIQESTNTSSASVDNGTAVQIRIGSGGISGDADWAGYIDDLRITKGIARYTSNFTPPTTAFLTL
jgi:hypothetical protein